MTTAIAITLVSLLALGCLVALGVWITEEPEEAGFILATLGIIFVIVGGIWGFGFLLHWWGAPWQ